MQTIETIIYNKDLLQVHIFINEVKNTAKPTYFINGIDVTNTKNMKSTYKALFEAIFNDYLFCYSLKKAE